MSHEKFFVTDMKYYSTSKPARLPGKSTRVDRVGPQGQDNPAPTPATDRKMGRSNKPGKAPL